MPIIRESNNYVITHEATGSKVVKTAMQGPQGPPGPAGPEGPQGPPGGSADVRETAPPAPENGLLWWQPSTSSLRVYSDGEWAEQVINAGHF